MLTASIQTMCTLFLIVRLKSRTVLNTELGAEIFIEQTIALNNQAIAQGQ